MAFGKERAKRKFEALLSPLLEAGERPVAELFSVPYFIVVTDRRVLWINTSKKVLAWADPRDSVEIHDVHIGAVDSKLRYRRPNGQEIKMTVAFTWRPELKDWVAALTSQAQQAFAM